jgi:type II secretory pathway pseudopilin PulG
MVALIASMAVMLVLMGAAVPSWRYVMKDMREEELLFRGTQIAEAIERYQRKNGNAPPPSLEVLVQGKYLRRLYKEPFAKDGKWRLVRPGEALPAPVSARPGVPAPPAPPVPSPLAQAVPSPFPGATTMTTPGQAFGAVVGVASRSKEKSLRVFNGRTRYDEWIFAAGQPRLVGKDRRPLVPVPQAGPSPGRGLRPTPAPSANPRATTPS